jgi:hypothetical protein
MSDKKNGNGELKDIKDNINSWSTTGSAEDLSSKASANPEEEKKKEEELLKDLQDQIDKLSSKDIIVQFMISLSSMAYKKMGLPLGTNDKYKSKEQAKLAVDSFDALLKVLNEEITERERENLLASLTNLQMNFVKAFGV